MQCSAVYCSAVQCSPFQCSAVQYNAVQPAVRISCGGWSLAIDQTVEGGTSQNQPGLRNHLTTIESRKDSYLLSSSRRLRKTRRSAVFFV